MESRGTKVKAKKSIQKSNGKRQDERIKTNEERTMNGTRRTTREEKNEDKQEKKTKKMEKRKGCPGGTSSTWVLTGGTYHDLDSHTQGVRMLSLIHI